MNLKETVTALEEFETNAPLLRSHNTERLVDALLVIIDAVLPVLRDIAAAQAEGEA